jgi:hypothetical protein
MGEILFQAVILPQAARRVQPAGLANEDYAMRAYLSRHGRRRDPAPAVCIERVEGDVSPKNPSA